MRFQVKLLPVIAITIILLVLSLVFHWQADVASASLVEQSPYPSPASTPFSVGPYKVFIPISRTGFPPPSTESYYMYTTTDVWGLGCELGTKTAESPGAQNRFVFLDFGNPNKDSNNNYGTQLFSGQLIDVYGINTAVYIFAQAYKYCLNNHGDYSSFLHIGVGTNNSGGSSLDIIATQHGIAWAQMVKDINTRLINDGIYTNVAAVGASNMEPGFNTYLITKKWVDGYQSVPYRLRLFNIGSADGCPLDYPPNEPAGYFPPHGCNNSWNQDQIYYISWGAGTGFIPEIYETLNEAHSKQWYRIGLFASLTRSSHMAFEGTITQRGACQQLLDEGDLSRWQTDCYTLDNRPEDAYTELHHWITAYNQYEHLTNSMKWPTDIRRYEGP